MEHSQRCGVSSSTLKLLLALPLSFLCFSYSQCSIFNILLLFFHSLFFSYIYIFFSLYLSIFSFEFQKRRPVPIGASSIYIRMFLLFSRGCGGDKSWFTIVSRFKMESQIKLQVLSGTLEGFLRFPAWNSFKLIRKLNRKPKTLPKILENIIVVG